jgi:response regulator RpfG family c-di-GMP phosphodiesterase
MRTNQKLRNARILIIDDAPTMLLFAQHKLQPHFDICIVNSESDDLNSSMQTPFDVLIINEETLLNDARLFFWRFSKKCKNIPTILLSSDPKIPKFSGSKNGKLILLPKLQRYDDILPIISIILQKQSYLSTRAA